MSEHEYKHWCGNCQIRIYIQRHYGRILTWGNCPYTCEYATEMRCSTEGAKGETMPRYIDASKAEQRIVALYRKEQGAYADVFNTAVDACQTIILDMYDNEAADVRENIHGTWIIDEDGNIECSVCGHHGVGDLYCERCGAQMDEGRDE